jgi:hypothetical protein
VEIGTSEAARQFKTHPNVLLRLILLGRLTAHKNPDGHWLISKESLDRWNSRRVRREPKAEQPSASVQMPTAAHAGV